MPPHVEKEQEQQGSSDPGNTTQWLTPLIYLVVRNRETSGCGTNQASPDGHNDSRCRGRERSTGDEDDEDSGVGGVSVKEMATNCNTKGADVTPTSGTSEFPVAVYTAAQHLRAREEGQSAASQSGK